ncbi:MAG: GNAT family N-acetyltransferase [Candidatus Brocadia sp.]|jgi:RimJ/RimL family protein N-acetyltransferase
MKPVFLNGKKIFLGPLSMASKIEGYTQWINDQETTLFMGSGRFPLNKADIREYIKSYSNSKDGMILGIFLKKTSRHIGNITLHMIDWRNRNAEIGVLIGDKKSRGKGYATEAIRLVADHAFNKLNLRKLYSGMVKGNEASKKIFEKVGFKVEGVLREHFYLCGKYLDCYRLALLKDEYSK